MSNMKYKFRDVGDALRKLRDFLLGRERVLHGRFHPLLAPRSIPPPDIPRGPEYKYSNQYYYNRNALNSVHPPVVGRVALGLKKCGDEDISVNKTIITFPTLPTPGFPYWWDGHCYYKCVRDECMPKAQPTPKEPPPPSPPPCPCPSPTQLSPPKNLNPPGNPQCK